jgi:hypothetical protein
VSAAYRALTSGTPPVLQRGPSIRDYLQWYKHVDLEPSRRFWTQYLDGVTDATPVSAQSRGTDKFSEVSASLSSAATARLNAIARRLKCPLNALVRLSSPVSSRSWVRS